MSFESFGSEVIKLRALEDSRVSRVRVFRVGPELDAQLEQRAKQAGVTPSSVIRDALVLYLELEDLQKEDSDFEPV